MQSEVCISKSIRLACFYLTGYSMAAVVGRLTGVGAKTQAVLGEMVAAR